MLTESGARGRAAALLLRRHGLSPGLIVLKVLDFDLPLSFAPDSSLLITARSQMIKLIDFVAIGKCRDTISKPAVQLLWGGVSQRKSQNLWHIEAGQGRGMELAGHDTTT